MLLNYSQYDFNHCHTEDIATHIALEPWGFWFTNFTS